MRSVARRYLELDLEISSLNTEIQALIDAAAPALIATKGIGYETAAALLVAAGDNPERLRTESAFAHLCGAAQCRRVRERPFDTAPAVAATVRPTALSFS